MKNININVYESPQQGYQQQPCQHQQSEQQKSATTTIIPVPLIVFLIIAIPVLSGYFRPTFISVPNPVVNNNTTVVR